MKTTVVYLDKDVHISTEDGEIVILDSAKGKSGTLEPAMCANYEFVFKDEDDMVGELTYTGNRLLNLNEIAHILSLNNNGRPYKARWSDKPDLEAEMEEK